jgi:creatinine amidohydrolase
LSVTRGAASHGDVHGGSARWQDLTVRELEARLDNGATVLWPIGATEQHGPHVVTGFDHIAAETVVSAAAEKLMPHVVVLPTLAFGSSAHWVGLGGTLTLSPTTLYAVIGDVSRSAQQAGATKLVMVNGHMGNIGVGMAVLAEFVDSPLDVEFVSYWDLIERRVLVDNMRQDAGVGHAGEFETAIGLHVGGLVREDAIPGDGGNSSWAGSGFDGPVIHRTIRAASDTLGGVVGSARAATPALGRAVLESAVEGLVAHCVAARRETIRE